MYEMVLGGLVKFLICPIGFYGTWQTTPWGKSAQRFGILGIPWGWHVDDVMDVGLKLG